MARLESLDRTRQDLHEHSTDLLYNVAITVADQISGLLVNAVSEGARGVLEAREAEEGKSDAVREGIDLIGRAKKL